MHFFRADDADRNQGDAAREREPEPARLHIRICPTAGRHENTRAGGFIAGVRRSFQPLLRALGIARPAPPYLEHHTQVVGGAPAALLRRLLEPASRLDIAARDTVAVPVETGQSDHRLFVSGSCELLQRRCRLPCAASSHRLQRIFERIRAFALQQGMAAGYAAGELFASTKTLGTPDLMNFLFAAGGTPPNAKK